MTSSETPWIFKLSKYLDLPERILLLSLVIGAILAAAKIDTSAIILISLFGLAAVFFLRAYSPVASAAPPEEKLDFKPLLSHTILPKVMWISSSIMAIGIAFWWSGLKGYEQMLFIGTSTMLVIFVLIAFLLATGAKHLNVMKPILFRAIPLALASVFILWTQSPALRYLSGD